MMDIIGAINREDFLRLRPLWSNIAQDIVLTTIPKDDSGAPILTPQDICETYDITPKECATLLRLPEFKKLVKDYKSRTDALGDNASYVVRAQMLASSIMEDVYLSAVRSPDPKDKLAAFKALSTAGMLDPSSNGTSKKATDAPSGAMVANVTINVPPGIPNMGHIYNSERVVNGELEHNVE